MSLGIFPSGDSPTVVRWVAFVVAIIALLICAAFLFSAVSAQISGKAVYRHGPKGLISENVSFESEPLKYNEAIQKLYFRAGAAGFIGCISLVFFRKLGE